MHHYKYENVHQDTYKYAYSYTYVLSCVLAERVKFEINTPPFTMIPALCLFCVAIKCILVVCLRKNLTVLAPIISSSAEKKKIGHLQQGRFQMFVCKITFELSERSVGCALLTGPCCFRQIFAMGDCFEAESQRDRTRSNSSASLPQRSLQCPRTLLGASAHHIQIQTRQTCAYAYTSMYV